MKFTKTALAVAFAGIAAAPIASADVTLSGYVGFVLEGTDEDDTADDPGKSNLGMGGDDSTLNVNASHELNSGLTGYGNWRVDAGLVGSGAVADNVHVGVKGGFGDVRVGEVPDALEYGQKANDALFDIGGENFGISYTGAFGPATVGVNWSPEGTGTTTSVAGERAGSDKIAAGIKFNAGGFGIGVGGASIGDDTAYSAGASFGFAGASVAVALKSRDFDATDSTRDTLSATLGYGIGNVSAKLSYAVETGDQNEDDNLIRLDLGYGLGGGMNLSTRITSFTDDSASAGDYTRFRVLFSKDF